MAKFLENIGHGARSTMFADLGHGVLDTAMVETAAYCPEAVTENLLQEVVRRMLAVGTPDKIVLFGSRTRGDARSDSDLDLLIIEASDLPRYKRSSRYLRALVGLFPAKDVVVWTPEEVAVWSEVPHAFITTALREGKTLYAR
jgi:uncharacterized protein